MKYLILSLALVLAGCYPLCVYQTINKEKVNTEPYWDELTIFQDSTLTVVAYLPIKSSSPKGIYYGLNIKSVTDLDCYVKDVRLSLIDDKNKILDSSDSIRVTGLTRKGLPFASFSDVPDSLRQMKPYKYIAIWADSISVKIVKDKFIQKTHHIASNHLPTKLKARYYAVIIIDGRKEIIDRTVPVKKATRIHIVDF